MEYLRGGRSFWRLAKVDGQNETAEWRVSHRRRTKAPDLD